VLATTAVPSLSQIYRWDTAHLEAAATHWTATAETWADAFTKLHQEAPHPGGVTWQGDTAEAAVQRMGRDRATVVGVSESLHGAASAARHGAADIRGAQELVLEAVREAREAGFTVGEDLSVTDRQVGGHPALRVARQAEAEMLSAAIRARAGELVAIDAQVGTRITSVIAAVNQLEFTETPAASGPPRQRKPGFEPLDRTFRQQPVTDPPPAPPQAGQAPDPTNPFIDDSRFGHWENVPPPPPYVGANPPPLRPSYRPFPDSTPMTVGPTTGMYTPGKTWIGDIDPPAVQSQEEYRFRLAGLQATTVTRMVNENGYSQQQRWVQNVYEYQRNTSIVFGGDVGMRGIEGEQGDIGGLPPLQNIDRTWKPISLGQIANLSANNMDTTYYLPDECGGTVKFLGGVAATGLGSAPPNPPIMTRPR
jgi:hypothetical protein